MKLFKYFKKQRLLDKLLDILKVDFAVSEHFAFRAANDPTEYNIDCYNETKRIGRATLKAIKKIEKL